MLKHPFFIGKNNLNTPSIQVREESFHSSVTMGAFFVGDRG